jgi:hypothetical protein
MKKFSFGRFIGGFSIGWSIVTVLNILTHTKEPIWMHYADGVFLVIAAVAIITLINKKVDPPTS